MRPYGLETLPRHRFWEPEIPFCNKWLSALGKPTSTHKTNSRDIVRRTWKRAARAAAQRICKESLEG